MAEVVITSKMKTLGHKCFRGKITHSKRGAQSVNIDILINLKKNKSTSITMRDKRNWVVILNKSDYVHKTDNIFCDKSEFILIKCDCFKHIISIEDAFKRNLRIIKNNLTDSTYVFCLLLGLLLVYCMDYQKYIRSAVL